MRIAVVSDIHGNLPGLEAVLADLEKVRPDVVLYGGDMARFVQASGPLRRPSRAALVRSRVK